MGAWGYGVFENDSALDWSNRFAEAPSRRALSQAWEMVFRSGYVEYDAAAAALAAAEVLAAMIGKPAPSLPPELAKWADDNRLAPVTVIPDATLAAGALRSVGQIADASEMKELVEGNGGLEEWNAVIEELVQRLGSVVDLLQRKE